MALLGHRDPFGGPGGVPGMPESGRMGDYVFTQEGELTSILSMTLTLGIYIIFSPRPNYKPNDGEGLPPASACAGRDYKQTTPRGFNCRMYVDFDPYQISVN